MNNGSFRTGLKLNCVTFGPHSNSTARKPKTHTEHAIRVRYFFTRRPLRKLTTVSRFLMSAFLKPNLLPVLLVGLSLSIGWGIRGNFGHEYGAMIPGALAGLAAVLLAGRRDWSPRCAFFAFFGALGWSFGGSMSY